MQSRHVETDVAPSAAEYLPSPQGKQADSAAAKVELEYFPCPHSVQTVVPAFAEYCPSGQLWQVELLKAPTSTEKVPGWHEMQKEDPNCFSPYVPAAHFPQYCSLPIVFQVMMYSLLLYPEWKI